MARVKPPLKLKGAFCVLDYWPESDTFQLFCDDDTGNTYDLGNDLNFVRAMGRVWGIDKIVFERALDLAKNYRSVQLIFEGNRVIPLIDRHTEKVSAFGEETKHATPITL